LLFVSFYLFVWLLDFGYWLLVIIVLMSFLLDLIFPRFCYGCGQEGDYLCQSCSDKISTLPVKKVDFADGLLGLFPYHHPLIELIKDLKFSLVTDICSTLAHLSLSRLKSDFPNLIGYWQEKSFVLVPVPLHCRRQNWRGFNQSDLLGRQVASALNIGFDNQLLARYKPTSPQSLQTSLTSRSQNLKSAFILKGKPSGNYLLFDDVSTSGATFSSVASIFPKSCSLWCLSLCLG
jgi:ComF family protein